MAKKQPVTLGGLAPAPQTKGKPAKKKGKPMRLGDADGGY